MFGQSGPAERADGPSKGFAFLIDDFTLQVLCSREGARDWSEAKHGQEA